MLVRELIKQLERYSDTQEVAVYDSANDEYVPLGEIIQKRFRLYAGQGQHEPVVCLQGE